MQAQTIKADDFSHLMGCADEMAVWKSHPNPKRTGSWFRRRTIRRLSSDFWCLFQNMTAVHLGIVTPVRGQFFNSNWSSNEKGILLVLPYLRWPTTPVNWLHLENNLNKTCSSANLTFCSAFSSFLARFLEKSHIVWNCLITAEFIFHLSQHGESAGRLLFIQQRSVSKAVLPFFVFGRYT